MFKLIVNGKNGREESEFKTRVEAESHLAKHTDHWGNGYLFEIKDHTAEDELKKDKEELRKTERLSRIEQFNSIDWSTVTTILELKSIVRSLVKEVTKDDK